MKTVAIYYQKGHSRSTHIAKSMEAGIKACGDKPILRRHDEYNGNPDCDAAVFYGFIVPLPNAMRDYKAAGKSAVHIDLGYWGRVEGGRMEGYHKVAVNDRHPHEYLMNSDMPSDRVSRFGLRAQPWRKNGKHILVAGMSSKNARSLGIQSRSWEMSVIEALKSVTDRPIIYRPKPGDRAAGPIGGTEYARHGPFEQYLDDCHAVVTHHSNAAIDAALFGVPVFSKTGAGVHFGLTNFGDIESPIYPDNRQQVINNLAYCQWTPAEMRSGECWQHLKSQGLI